MTLKIVILVCLGIAVICRIAVRLLSYRQGGKPKDKD